MVTEKRIE